MADLRLDIKKIKPAKGDKFFFDANVWLLILRPEMELKDYEKAYIKFFDDIISTKDCRICINNLLVSEVYNAYMRIAFNLYKDTLHLDPKNKLTEKEIAKLKYKEDYRSTDNHDFNLQTFKDDFLAYSDYFIQIENEMKEVDILYVTKTLPANTDFNDYYFFEYCLSLNIPFVTNDGDFYYDGIQIITNNNKILKR